MLKTRSKIEKVLYVLVILSIIRQFFLGNYQNMFLGILTLILFMVPEVIDKKLGVTIPIGLETVLNSFERRFSLVFRAFPAFQCSVVLFLNQGKWCIFNQHPAS